MTIKRGGKFPARPGVGAGDRVGEQHAGAVDSADQEAAESTGAGIGMLTAGEDGAEGGDRGEDPIGGRRPTEDDADDRAEAEGDDQRQRDLGAPTSVGEGDGLRHGFRSQPQFDGAAGIQGE
jgi:hypothetical protein